jgi:hypothetical protein
MDGLGHITQETLGNYVVTNRTYHAATPSNLVATSRERADSPDTLALNSKTISSSSGTPRTEMQLCDVRELGGYQQAQQN